jgi:hypothetical protein
MRKRMTRVGGGLGLGGQKKSIVFSLIHNEMFFPRVNNKREYLGIKTTILLDDVIVI